MKRLLSIILIPALLIGLAVSAGSARAQEIAPEHLALARQYVDLTDKNQIYERTLVQTGVGTMRTIVQQNPEIADTVNEVVGLALEEYRDRKGDLMGQIARVYALRFSVEELEQIVAFYSSEVGQKLASQNVEASRDITRVVSVWRANLADEFFAKVRLALRDRGIDI